MYLALKRTPASDATWWQRACAWLIKARLVSQYSHAGVVIGGRLYHATAQHGLTDEPFDMATASAGWDFVDWGSAHDAAALALYQRRKGAGYDWFGLLAFVLPGRYTDSARLYCFAWAALARGLDIRQRVTPELLLVAALRPT